MPNIGSKPSQPRHFNFPKRRFGKFITLSKLHGLIDGSGYTDCSRDVAFCFACIKAIKTGKMKMSGNANDSSLNFIFNGIHSWKEAHQVLKYTQYYNLVYT